MQKYYLHNTEGEPKTGHRTDVGGP